MDEKESFGQPLMMRKDYGKEDKKKDALIIKTIPIDDYDETKIKKLCEGEWDIEDYDDHSCNGGCFFCDR